jgi:hypothetical protein
VTRPDPSRLGRALAITIAVWASLLALNDSLPYLGLRDDSCQTMFSGLEWSERGNNHAFVPQHAVSDVWAYVETSELEISPPPSARLAQIADWLERPGRVRNTEALRVAIRQLCDGGVRVSLTTQRIDGGEPVRHADACSDPSVSSPHAWVPVRLYETDLPTPEVVR